MGFPFLDPECQSAVLEAEEAAVAKLSSAWPAPFSSTMVRIETIAVPIQFDSIKAWIKSIIGVTPLGNRR